ncbi:MAG: DPP IV N-terminal domain-containing protein [Anaerolineae bacterium]
MKLRILSLCLFISIAACSPGGATAPATEPPAPTTAPTGTSVPPTETPAATPTSVAPAVLPAPLLFLSNRSGSDQIWRLDVDGVTLMQLTNEAAPVTDFDASPVDGRLAYVSDNDLIVANADGSDRALLVDGPPQPTIDAPDRINTEMKQLRWSLDDARIAYGLNGVNLIDAAGGEPVVLQQSDPVPLPPDFQSEGPVKFYWPNVWSPDGSRLLIEFAYFPEGGGLSVLNLSDGSLFDLSSPEGIVCCNASWATDGSAVYFANPSPGLIAPGLWRASLGTDADPTLIRGIDGETFNLVGFARQLNDGKLYYFFAQAPQGFPESGYWPLSMYRADADGVTGQTQLRDDAHILGEALWASDGSGAVIVDAEESAQANVFPLTGPLLFLKSDGSPQLTLAGNGHMLRWGK